MLQSGLARLDLVTRSNSTYRPQSCGAPARRSRRSRHGSASSRLKRRSSPHRRTRPRRAANAGATVLSRAQHGMEAPQVSVEVHLGAGLPALSIVGLPKPWSRRARIACVRRSLRRTLNFRPAASPSISRRPIYRRRADDSTCPIALGVLVASGQIPAEALERLRVLWRAFIERRIASRARHVASSLPGRPAGAPHHPAEGEPR